MEASREVSRTPPRLPPCSDVSVFQKTRMSHFWDTHHKVVVGFLNQEHPDRLGNTLLVALCPESLDKYPEVAAILAPNVAQLLHLPFSGVVVGSPRRAVRLLFSSECPAISNTVGHKGHSAPMPCPV